MYWASHLYGFPMLDWLVNKNSGDATALTKNRLRTEKTAKTMLSRSFAKPVASMQLHTIRITLFAAHALA